MIKINLIPEELKKTKAAEPQFLSAISFLKSAFLKKAKFVLFGLIAFHLVLVLAALFSVLSLGGITKKFQGLQPQIAEAKKLSAEAAVLEGNVKSMKRLAEKRFLWARPLSQVSGLTTSRIWIRRLFIQTSAAGPQSKETLTALNIEGCVASKYGDEMGLVAKFIKAMQDNKELSGNFTEIRLGPTDKGIAGKLPVMNFKVSCYLKKDLL